SKCRDKVSDHLGANACKNDGYHDGEQHPIAKLTMTEHCFHERLAIVEGAFDGDGVNVVTIGGGHHAPLHIGDPAVGEQYDDVHVRTASECIDGGAAGIA